MTIKQPEPTKSELSDLESLLVGFGAELLLYGAAALVPNEYLQQVQSGMARAFSTIGKIAEYFGGEKKLESLKILLNAKHNSINEPGFLKWNTRLSAVLDGLGPNIGMKILEKIACKIFPGASTEIKVFLNAFSISQFIMNPFGSLNAIIDAGTALFAKVIPDPKDLMEVLIAEPIKWIL
ncbi:MAG: hypothetical protein Q8R66_05360 [Methanobacteriaceae archaeon]|nr:hypothetical protein [Methanobacteriaceae archaeon]